MCFVERLTPVTLYLRRLYLRDIDIAVETGAWSVGCVGVTLCVCVCVCVCEHMCNILMSEISYLEKSKNISWRI